MHWGHAGGPGRRRLAAHVVAAAFVAAACTSTSTTTGATTSTTAASSTASASASAPPPTSVAGLPPAGPISGTALDAAGQPFAAHLVTLREDRGIASDVFGTFAAALTLGLSCAAGADPCRSSGATSTTTGADGRFAFPQAAVERARGRSRGVVLQLGDPTREGSVVVRLPASPGGDLGSLQLWDPHLTATPDGADVVLRWTGPPGADPRTVLHADVVDGPPRGDRSPPVLVRLSPHGPSADVAIDRRAFEDRPAVAVLSAGFSRPRAGQQPRIDWTAAPKRLPGGAGVPLSRGAACTVDGPPVAHTCALTDGDLTTPLLGTDASVTASSPACLTGIACAGAVRAVAIDLGQERPVGVIAVRATNPAVVEVSSDGQSYRRAPAARLTSTWPATVASAGGDSIRYVRVTPGPAGVLDPAEVSAWAPALPPTVEPAPASSGDIPMAPSQRTPAGRSGARQVWPRALAILALIAVAAAGYAAGRRRRRTDLRGS